MRHFSDELEPANINRIADLFNFSDRSYVERFIMDFEIYYYVSAQFASILRGGMCMPFHTGLDVQRLSIDVDLFTRLEASEVGEAMQNLNTPNDISVNRRNPRHPLPIPNLLTFDVEFASNFSNRGLVKIDFMCDMPLDLPTRSTGNDFDILDFTIDYPLNVLARGALISDKITSLGLKTIGLRPKTGTLPAEFPKQVYDISTLLKGSTRRDIADSFDIFEDLTQFKAGIFDDGRYRVSDIMRDVESSLCGMFVFEYQVALSNEYANRLASFINSYLQSNRYRRSRHISDLLLVWLYARFLVRSADNPNLKDTLIDGFASIITSYLGILNYSPDEKNSRKKQMLEDMPALAFSPKILRSSTCETVFLIREINLIGDNSTPSADQIRE